ncbi:uncharacterized protein METZ01_LOCUS258556, partial [marine metagenome]
VDQFVHIVHTSIYVETATRSQPLQLGREVRTTGTSLKKPTRKTEE